ncbi:MAG: hypothetical protein P8M34_07315 [Saprospiraceae bacterium]|nr:hypothetical protein [Saprospiraceae bacterium]
MKRGTWAIIGYVLFLFGVLAILLSMIGLSFQPLAFLDVFGRTGGFVLRLVCILAGIIILYVSSVKRE